MSSLHTHWPGAKISDTCPDQIPSDSCKCGGLSGPGPACQVLPPGPFQTWRAQRNFSLVCHRPNPAARASSIVFLPGCSLCFLFSFFFFFPWLDLLAMKQQRFKRPLCCVIPLVGKTVFLKLGGQGNWHHVPLHTSRYLATVHFLIATNHGRLHVFLAIMSLYSNVEA